MSSLVVLLSATLDLLALTRLAEETQAAGCTCPIWTRGYLSFHDGFGSVDVVGRG